MYLLVTIACALMAGVPLGISIVLKKLRAGVEETISSVAEEQMGSLKEQLKEGLSDDNMESLKEKYKQYTK